MRHSSTLPRQWHMNTLPVSMQAVTLAALGPPQAYALLQCIAKTRQYTARAAAAARCSWMQAPALEIVYKDAWHAGTAAPHTHLRGSDPVAPRRLCIHKVFSGDVSVAGELEGEVGGRLRKLHGRQHLCTPGQGRGGMGGQGLRLCATAPTAAAATADAAAAGDTTDDDAAAAAAAFDAAAATAAAAAMTTHSC